MEISVLSLDSPQLVNDISQIVERGKRLGARQVNSTMILTYWQVGKRINEDILRYQRATYGKQIIASVARQLEEKFGGNFAIRNLRRMMQFADLYADIRIVSTLSTQLSWSHFVELLPIKSEEARNYYSKQIADETWTVHYLRKQIGQKAFESKQIANAQLPIVTSDLKHTFKDAYFFDFLDVKDGYEEDDLEAAILKELELFILELGTDFAFIERQKRMAIDGEESYLDLLFFNRKLQRLVAIELKIGKCKAAYMGQMELYLKWLNKHEKKAGEEFPIGLILCTEASSEKIELLEMCKDGIMVAEYWAELPPKEQLKQKIHEALLAARERIARKKRY